MAEYKKDNKQVYRVLGQLGLRRAEIDIYKLLLKSDSLTVRAIAEQILLPKSTTYDNIYNLLGLDLVQEIKVKSGKKFKASSPEVFGVLINKKIKKVQSDLSVLKDLKISITNIVGEFSELLIPETHNLQTIRSRFNNKDWESIYKSFISHDFNKLISVLGNDYFQLVFLELEKQYPADIKLDQLKLHYLLHTGSFNRFLIVYNDIYKNLYTKNLFLRYKNIIGERVSERFLRSLKKESGQQNDLAFIPDYIEYIWLQNGIAEAKILVNTYMRRGLRNYKYQGHLQFIKAELFRHAGEYEKAIPLLQLSIKNLQNTYHTRIVALSYKSLSVCYRNLGKWHKAFDNVTAAVELSKEFGDKSLISRTVLSMGSFHEIRGNAEEALKNHLEAYKLGEEMGSLRDKFYAGQNIGITYLQLHSVDNAYKFFQKALQPAKELNRGYYIDMWIGFIEANYLNQYELGMSKLEKALLEAENADEQKRIDIATSLIGATFFIKGENLQEGERILKRLRKSTSSGVIRNGIVQLLDGDDFLNTQLCS